MSQHHHDKIAETSENETEPSPRQEKSQDLKDFVAGLKSGAALPTRAASTPMNTTVDARFEPRSTRDRNPYADKHQPRRAGDPAPRMKIRHVPESAEAVRDRHLARVAALRTQADALPTPTPRATKGSDFSNFVQGLKSGMALPTCTSSTGTPATTTRAASPPLHQESAPRMKIYKVPESPEEVYQRHLIQVAARRQEADALDPLPRQAKGDEFNAFVHNLEDNAPFPERDPSLAPSPDVDAYYEPRSESDRHPYGPTLHVDGQPPRMKIRQDHGDPEEVRIKHVARVAALRAEADKLSEVPRVPKGDDFQAFVGGLISGAPMPSTSRVPIAAL